MTPTRIDHWPMNLQLFISLLLLLLDPSICRQPDIIDEPPRSTLTRPFNCEAVYSECEPNHLCPENLDIISTCHVEYINEQIIEKCRSFQDADVIEDNSLFAPITCTEKNITYWNVYCGICNFEKELYKFEYWSPWLSCKKIINESVAITRPTASKSMESILGAGRSPGPGSVAERSADPLDESKMLPGLRVDRSESGSKLISVLNNSTYQCKILRVLSMRLRAHVPNCFRVATEQSGVAISEIFRKSIFAHLYQKNNRDQETDTKFCLDTKYAADDFCEYRNEYGEACTLNLFLEPSFDEFCNQDSYIETISPQNENETILMNECSNHTSKKNHIFVCGPDEGKIWRKIKNIVFNVMDHISMFLLLLYLVICTNKQNLRSLPKRVFYSYSVSLLALYLSEFILKHIRSCVIKYYVFFYVWQSHSFWILITSYDLWRIVYNSLKLLKIEVEKQTARYAVYCSIGWGLPVVLLCVLFPTLKDDQKSWSCPSVSGFQNELICSSSCELNQYTYHFGWITIFVFLVLAPCLLVLTCVFVCLSTRNRARANVNRTYTVAMIKVAIMMGFHWMLLVYLAVFNSGEKFNVVYEFISSFHGSFVFFAFGLEKNNLNRLKRLMNRGAVVEETQDTSFTQIDQEMKSPVRGDKLDIDNENVEK
ncbi:uncharacterized protein LOC135834702 [Planococcus citri]|uniref:uncharacterized protein LOC135834702 n=1 Tax=Planococcus citri TaxID=170843 RepID=UPI0031F958CA